MSVFRLRRLAVGVIGALVPALVVAACGGADPTSTPVPTRPAATPAAAATATTAAAPTATRPPSSTTAPGATAVPTATAPPAATVAPTATRPAATPAPTATSAPAPTATAQAVPRGQLRIAMAQASLRDLSMVPGKTTWRYYNDAVFDNLVGLSNDGKLEARNGVATSWQSNAAATEWTLKLRDSVVFQNGEKATSRDFKFSLEYFYAPNAPISIAALKSTIASIETPDDSTVVMKLNGPSIFFPLLWLTQMADTGLGYLLPRSNYESNTVDFVARNPLGSGPYKYKETKLGESLTLDATPRHWLTGVPKYQTLTYIIVPEETVRVTVLKTGGAEFIEISRVSVEDVGRSGFDVMDTRDSNVDFINYHEQWMNYPGGNPLANEKVRQALSIAIDRDTLAKTFMRGRATPTIDYPVTNWDAAYKGHPVPAQNIAQARTLIRDAGYPNGFELQVMIFPWTGLPEGPEMMEAVATWWEQAGVKVVRTPVEIVKYTTAWSTQAFGKPTVGGVLNIAKVPVGTRFTSPRYTTTGPFRISQDPELIDLTNQWAAAPNLQAYVSLGQKLQDVEIPKATSAVLFESGAVFGIKKGVAPATWSPGRGYASLNIRQLVTG